MQIAIEDICMRPDKIILQEIEQGSYSTISVKNVNRIRKNVIYESRRKTLPANQTSTLNIHESL